MFFGGEKKKEREREKENQRAMEEETDKQKEIKNEKQKDTENMQTDKTEEIDVDVAVDNIESESELAAEHEKEGEKEEGESEGETIADIIKTTTKNAISPDVVEDKKTFAKIESDELSVATNSDADADTDTKTNQTETSRDTDTELNNVIISEKEKEKELSETKDVSEPVVTLTDQHDSSTLVQRSEYVIHKRPSDADVCIICRELVPDHGEHSIKMGCCSTRHHLTCLVGSVWLPAGNHIICPVCSHPKDVPTVKNRTAQITRNYFTQNARKNTAEIDSNLISALYKFMLKKAHSGGFKSAFQMWVSGNIGHGFCFMAEHGVTLDDLLGLNFRIETIKRHVASTLDQLVSIGFDLRHLKRFEQNIKEFIALYQVNIYTLQAALGRSAITVTKIINLRLSAQTMADLGITVHQLCIMGMRKTRFIHFENTSMQEWIQVLGLRKEPHIRLLRIKEADFDGMLKMVHWNYIGLKALLNISEEEAVELGLTDAANKKTTSRGTKNNSRTSSPTRSAFKKVPRKKKFNKQEPRRPRRVINKKMLPSTTTTTKTNMTRDAKRNPFNQFEESEGSRGIPKVTIVSNQTKGENINKKETDSSTHDHHSISEKTRQKESEMFLEDHSDSLSFSENDSGSQDTSTYHPYYTPEEELTGVIGTDGYLQTVSESESAMPLTHFVDQQHQQQQQGFAHKGMVYYSTPPPTHPFVNYNHGIHPQAFQYYPPVRPVNTLNPTMFPGYPIYGPKGSYVSSSSNGNMANKYNKTRSLTPMTNTRPRVKSTRRQKTDTNGPSYDVPGSKDNIGAEGDTSKKLIGLRPRITYEMKKKKKKESKRGGGIKKH